MGQSQKSRNTRYAPGEIINGCHHLSSFLLGLTLKYIPTIEMIFFPMGACFVIGTNTYYKTGTHWSYHIIYYFDSRTQWGLVLTSNTKHAPIGCVNSQWVLVFKTSPHWVRESPMGACFVATDFLAPHLGPELDGGS